MTDFWHFVPPDLGANPSRRCGCVTHEIPKRSYVIPMLLPLLGKVIDYKYAQHDICPENRTRKEDYWEHVS
jgi:hypothetical protein